MLVLSTGIKLQSPYPQITRQDTIWCLGHAPVFQLPESLILNINLCPSVCRDLSNKEWIQTFILEWQRLLQEWILVCISTIND